jgi:DNA-binding cell septation regulator SpoVG
MLDKISELKVVKFKTTIGDSKVVGVMSFKYDDAIYLNKIKLVKDKEGKLFIAPPDVKDKKSDKYYKYFSLSNKDLYKTVLDLAVEEFDKQA